MNISRIIFKFNITVVHLRNLIAVIRLHKPMRTLPRKHEIPHKDFCRNCNTGKITRLFFFLIKKFIETQYLVASNSNRNSVISEFHILHWILIEFCFLYFHKIIISIKINCLCKPCFSMFISSI